MTARALGPLALAAAVLAASPAARAQEAPGAFAPVAVPGGGFGAVNQWVISGEANVFLHTQSGGGWQIQLRPALDVFIASNISVGGVVTFFHAKDGDTVVALGGRAGFNVNIADRLGFWPTAGINAGHTSNSMQNTSSTYAAAHAFAPFLFHIVPHLFAGLGPSVDLGLSDGHRDFGVDSMIGGWF